MKYFKKECVDSTNNAAKQLLNKNRDLLLREGFVFTSETQHSGKGTKNKFWYSESSDGLYFSLVLKPTHFDLDKLEQYHLDIASDIVFVIKSITGITCDIKWPNDLFLNGKKVAGILMESSTKNKQSQLEYLIIGIGLNIANESFPNELADIATSLFLESGKKFEKQFFIKPLASQLKKRFVKS